MTYQVNPYYKINDKEKTIIKPDYNKYEKKLIQNKWGYVYPTEATNHNILKTKDRNEETLKNAGCGIWLTPHGVCAINCFFNHPDQSACFLAMLRMYMGTTVVKFVNHQKTGRYREHFTIFYRKEAPFKRMILVQEPGVKVDFLSQGHRMQLYGYEKEGEPIYYRSKFTPLSVPLNKLPVLKTAKQSTIIERLTKMGFKL